MISIRKSSDEEYEVTVSGTPMTTHHVRLPEADRVRLAGTEIPAERLIEESFHFLLEREPNTSILSSFYLSVIGKYFPEYPTEIRKRLG